MNQFVDGILLGLSLGSTCLATCLPVFVPFLLRDKKAVKNGLLQTAEFLSGRLLGYLLFGALFGIIGGGIPARTRTIFVDAVFVTMGALMIYQGIRKEHKEICAASRLNKFISRPIIYGFLIGVNLCPAFAIALSGAAQTGGVLGGMVLFAGFFVGTSVWFLPLGLFAGITVYKWVRRIARIIAIIVGAYFLVKGTAAIVLDIPTKIETAAENSSVMSFYESDTLYIFPDGEMGREFSETLIRRRQSISKSSTSPARLGFTRKIILTNSLSSVPKGASLICFANLTDSAETALVRKDCAVMAIQPAKTLDKEILVEFIESYYFRKKTEKGFIFKYRE